MWCSPWPLRTSTHIWAVLHWRLIFTYALLLRLCIFKSYYVWGQWVKQFVIHSFKSQQSKVLVTGKQNSWRLSMNTIEPPVLPSYWLQEFPYVYFKGAMRSFIVLVFLLQALTCACISFNTRHPKSRFSKIQKPALFTWSQFSLFFPLRLAFTVNYSVNVIKRWARRSPPLIRRSQMASFSMCGKPRHTKPWPQAITQISD